MWDAFIGEYLLCERESFNRIDRYTVAVLKNDTVVGHILKKLYQIYLLFLSRGGCSDREQKIFTRSYSRGTGGPMQTFVRKSS